MKQYIMTKSLTWWASFVPLLAGLFVATAPVHGLHSVVAAIDLATGNMSAPMLINFGLVGIGLRKAIGD